MAYAGINHNCPRVLCTAEAISALCFKQHADRHRLGTWRLCTTVALERIHCYESAPAHLVFILTAIAYSTTIARGHH